MIHKFFFAELSDNPAFDYQRYYGMDADVSLHDDLVQYINDSLWWISSFNPACNMEPQSGLNMFGPTVIRASGAERLLRISKSWASLFKESPPELSLTGGFELEEGQSLESGTYAKHHMDRDKVVSSFEKLAVTCLRVSESKDRTFIMHFGI
ncbi:hypothetical protein shim_03020 [Shimia sp. SK013]|uniref:hypothetical protein n=1 Tax=Shimia sp. SK013 TaxID=1389006 RepID=UPI0006B4039E|nr:hypothetical protein [Shimia sp. SK013]KPA23693.1 hypothetical protein shim_03020 [Shimia sp. SK013]